MTIEKGSNESVLDHKYRLLLDKSKGDADYGWDDIEKELKIGLAKDTIRKGSIFLPEFEQYMIEKLAPTTDIPAYKEVMEHKADGTTSSDKLIRLTEEDMKTPEALIKAHGLDPNEWEMISSRNSMWNQTVDKTLYYSRVNVKPKVNGLNIEKLVEKLTEKVKPIKLNTTVVDSDRMLEIPLVDMHWGVADWDYYQETLFEIKELIHSKRWDVIYIPIGNDLLHNDTFDGKTSNGTQIEKVDIEQAFTDAFNFYSEIYTSALLQSNQVVSDYVCGNHDKVMSWGLTKALEVKFPTVVWDTSIKNKKLFTWKDIAILSAHGDKGSGRLPKTILKEYGKLIADKKVVEIHTGHLHYNHTKDDFGVVFRTLPTKAKTDDWHTEQSFLGAGKYFSLFEYKKDLIKTIHNI